jgi:hypothetical protein
MPGGEVIGDPGVSHLVEVCHGLKLHQFQPPRNRSLQPLPDETPWFIPSDDGQAFRRNR